MIPDSDSVFISREPGVYYDSPLREPAPELDAGEAAGPAAVLLRRLLIAAGLDAQARGTAAWNPLSEIVRPGDRVVLKPNWVFHLNESGAGLDCLVTHVSVLEAVLRYAVKCAPREIVIGDAPLQGCHLPELWQAIGIGGMVKRFAGSGVPVEVRDFRSVRRTTSALAKAAIPTGRRRENYVQFDLGRSSWLEPVTQGSGRFRVDMYDPREMERTHAPGVHRYQVAREIIEADVVIGLPKLKTHKRAGITGALKNFIGINGRKDFLPHHRFGGSAQGGDNYPGRDFLRTLSEYCADYSTQLSAAWMRWILQTTGDGLLRLDAIRRFSGDMGGSWHGNDTIWRTILDLNTIVRYGRPDGTIAPNPQRRLLHVTDAIVAGEGEGPMHPSPIRFGALTMACDSAAADYVHGFLMGFDPGKIPLLRNAVLNGDPSPRAIRACVDGRWLDAAAIPALGWPRFQPAPGWRGHCEMCETRQAKEARTC